MLRLYTSVATAHIGEIVVGEAFMFESWLEVLRAWYDWAGGVAAKWLSVVQTFD